MRNYSVPFTNGDAGEPGCWIDGHWGQYGADRVIQIAAGQGWEPSSELDRLIAEYAYARLECIGTRGDSEEGALAAVIEEYNRPGGKDYFGGAERHPLDPGADDGLVMEWLLELSIECEVYLNGIIAVDAETGDAPYCFGWHDGEFYLWSREDWEEAE